MKKGSKKHKKRHFLRDIQDENRKEGEQIDKNRD